MSEDTKRSHGGNLGVQTIKPRPRKAEKVTGGAKLLCINDRNLHRTYVPGPPVEGRTYCVREVYSENGVEGVLLYGIDGPRIRGGLECGFLLSRFRWVHD